MAMDSPRMAANMYNVRAGIVLSFILGEQILHCGEAMMVSRNT